MAPPLSLFGSCEKAWAAGCQPKARRHATPKQKKKRGGWGWGSGDTRYIGTTTIYQELGNNNTACSKKEQTTRFAAGIGIHYVMTGTFHTIQKVS